MADLEQIYRQNADIVYRFLIAKTGSLELAEELTQETFYQAVRSIDRYDGTSRISTWLCGIARNVLLTHLRKNRNTTLPLEEQIELAVASAEDVVIRKTDLQPSGRQPGDTATQDNRRPAFQRDRGNLGTY